MSDFTEISKEDSDYMKELQNQNSMTIDQINKIKDDIKELQPLVAPAVPISSLRSSYSDGSAFGFLDGITFLEERYNAIYMIRGDGNCFYRSFIFSYMEAILRNFLTYDRKKMDASIEELNHFKFKLKASFNFLINNGQCKDIIELFYEEFYDLVSNLLELPSIEELINRFFLSQNNTPSPSDSICCYLRILTSTELKVNQDIYTPFIFDSVYPTMEQYCQNEIEPIDKEVEQINIIAITNYFYLNFNILYLDRNCTEFSVPAIEFKAEDIHKKVIAGKSFEYNKINFNLLYRPGHYDSLI